MKCHFVDDVWKQCDKEWGFGKGESGLGMSEMCGVDGAISNRVVVVNYQAHDVQY